LVSGLAKRWVLPSDVTAPSQARAHIKSACGGLPPETADVARLLVTELVSNAVLHGSGTVLLTVAREGPALRVEVFDESPAAPVVVNADSLLEHGMGLRLVDALADSWGTAARGDAQPGKRVWFTLG
jgi:anti-sigma regulatory factor (Ser/Thr protein kinase)